MGCAVTTNDSYQVCYLQKRMMPTDTAGIEVIFDWQKLKSENQLAR